MSNYQVKIANYAEELQDQIYLLQSERGHQFATSMGMSVSKALALIQIELSRLANQ